MFFILIVGFALSFYTLLSDQAPFKMPGRAIVKTTVMMMGELEFDVIFVDNYKNPKLLRYRKLSLIIFFFFVILMTIVVMNLLVSCFFLINNVIKHVNHATTIRLWNKSIFTNKNWKRNFSEFKKRVMYYLLEYVPCRELRGLWKQLAISVIPIVAGIWRTFFDGKIWKQKLYFRSFSWAFCFFSIQCMKRPRYIN